MDPETVKAELLGAAQADAATCADHAARTAADQRHRDRCNAKMVELHQVAADARARRTDAAYDAAAARLRVELFGADGKRPDLAALDRLLARPLSPAEEKVILDNPGWFRELGGTRPGAANAQRQLAWNRLQREAAPRDSDGEVARGATRALAALKSIQAQGSALFSPAARLSPRVTPPSWGPTRPVSVPGFGP